MFARRHLVLLAQLALCPLLAKLPLLAQIPTPLCPFAKPAKPLPVLRLQIPVSLPKEALRASVLLRRNETNIEVETTPEGRITCATPLSFPSAIFLPYEMSAIEKGPG